MLSKKMLGRSLRNLIQNEGLTIQFDSKVDSDDSIVAFQQDAADFFDSIAKGCPCGCVGKHVRCTEIAARPYRIVQLVSLGPRPDSCGAANSCDRVLYRQAIAPLPAGWVQSAALRFRRLDWETTLVVTDVEPSECERRQCQQEQVRHADER
jgi:hypothetical protein